MIEHKHLKLYKCVDHDGSTHQCTEYEHRRQAHSTNHTSSVIPLGPPVNGNSEEIAHSDATDLYVQVARYQQTHELTHKLSTKKKNNQCIRDTESYAFLISWCIINYFIILMFSIFLLTWHDVSQKSMETRKNLLVILRQVNLHE